MRMTAGTFPMLAMNAPYSESWPHAIPLGGSFMHMDDALWCIWWRSVRGQSTLTIVDLSYANFRELRGGEVRSTGTPRSSLHSMVGCGHVPLRLSAMVPGATGAGQGRDRPVPQLWVAARGRPRVRVQLDVRRPVSGRFGVPRLRGRCRRLSHLHRGSAELRPRPGREPAPHPRDRHLVSKRTSENSPSTHSGE